MEGGAVKSTSNESRMGVSDADTISFVCSISRPVFTNMERCWSVGIRDAKVSLFPPDFPGLATTSRIGRAHH